MGKRTTFTHNALIAVAWSCFFNMASGLLMVASVLHLLCSTTLTFVYSNESRQSWEVLLNVSTKKPACRLSAGCRVEEGGVEWERIPLLQRNSRVQQHPDTGILLKKASIVCTEKACTPAQKKSQRWEGGGRVIWGFRHLLGFWPWYGLQMTDIFGYCMFVETGTFTDRF